MEQKRRVTFLSFGGGLGYRGASFRAAARRIGREAHRLGVFDEVAVHFDKDLKRDFPEFWKEHGAFINTHQRGCGYWLWKSFLILHHLNQIRDGDILMYVDAGCELNPYGRPRLMEYFELCSEHSTLTFRVQTPIKRWTKMDTLIRLDPELQTIEQYQNEGCVILLKREPKVIRLVEEWFAVSAENNYHYLDDSESVAPNDGDYREHRHDQAILTLLLIKQGLDFCLHDRCEGYFARKRQHIEGAHYPIWTSRHKSRIASPQMHRLRILKTEGLMRKALLYPGYIASHFSIQNLRWTLGDALRQLGLKETRPPA